MAAFNGNCAQATAIVNAAKSMGAGGPALDGCAKSATCK
jgi:hypothetical protein